MRKLILIGFGLLLAANSKALDQADVKLSLQIRHRLEMDNKDFSDETALNDFNLLRTRLGLTFTPADKLEAFIQIQDSRTFGEELSTLIDGSADNLDLHQGYFRLIEFLNLPVELKVGRMEVIYDAERLMGAVGWSNIGRSFDGGILSLHPQECTIDIFSLKEVEKLAPGDAGDKNVFGVYVDSRRLPSHTAQAFLIWQQLRPISMLSRYTAGIYLNGKFGDFYHVTEFAYQDGKISDLDVSAFLFALNLGFVFSGAEIRPEISAGVDYLSGDDNSTDDTYKVFDTLYATNHKYYGYMDYFTNIPADTYGRGLVDLHARFSVIPFGKATAQWDYHIFGAAQDYALSDASTTRDFGSELDFTLGYQYSGMVNVTAGASLFAPGKIFEETRGEDTSTWYYLMTTVNF